MQNVDTSWLYIAGLLHAAMYVYLLCQNYKKAKQVHSLKIAKIQTK